MREKNTTINRPIPFHTGVYGGQLYIKERNIILIFDNTHVTAEDSAAIVCSRALVLQYTGDMGNVTWFPMQSFHVSAAVKAISSNFGNLRFVEVDLADADESDHPPMFAFIARRTKGVKV